MATATYLHRVDSNSSSRVIIVRQTGCKVKPTTSTLNLDETPPILLKKPRKSLFNMRRRQGKDPNSTEEKRIFTKENCLSCCKKFTAFMFSRVGLFMVMMGYVALGGFLFRELESGNELRMRIAMEKKLDDIVMKLWVEVLRVNPLPLPEKKQDFGLFATNELEQFEKTVVQKVLEGFDGRTTNSEQDWNYFGAVLYAVTLVSTIGYGHITTKTDPGKIATILYSAVGVPLMMLFVANIGKTMARMFQFVFSRITMIFCCRMSNKKKRALVLKNRQKMIEKPDQSNVIVDGKLPMPTEQIKSNLKSIKDDSIKIEPSNTLPITSNSATDIRQLPADIRLNMLTGVIANSNTSRASSVQSIGEKSKDAIFRINELIRRDSVQNINEINNHESNRRKSVDINPIEYYINETNKLTNNLDTSSTDKTIEKDENNMKQVKTIESEETSEKKKSLKRSKSESSHNRRLKKKAATDQPTSNDNESVKPTRRRFFFRKSRKLKTESNPDESEKSPQKSQSFNEHSPRTLPPPPDYEQSKIDEITRLPPSPTTVTWKAEHEFYPTIDLTNPDLDDDEDDEDEDEESVPLLVTVFVIPLYLTLGAILFSIWEQWTFLNSFYFCFITLTTIGFGDFVPGAALKVEAEKEKLISAAAYILFGLVLISMCVNLMKEQLSQKVKRVANKLNF